MQIAFIQTIGSIYFDNNIIDDASTLPGRFLFHSPSHCSCCSFHLLHRFFSSVFCRLLSRTRGTPLLAHRARKSSKPRLLGSGLDRTGCPSFIANTGSTTAGVTARSIETKTLRKQLLGLSFARTCLHSLVTSTVTVRPMGQFAV